MPKRSNDRPPVVRAGVYTRISWDPEGQRAGVERQRVDCEALCACRGWEIGQYVEDNDASAYSGKPRRAYERMLSAIEEGAIGAIVTWHNDRYTAHRKSWRPSSTSWSAAGSGSRCDRRRLRPDDAGGTLYRSNRRSRRPQGVRAPQPAGSAQAPGAGRARAGPFLSLPLCASAHSLPGRAFVDLDCSNQPSFGRTGEDPGGVGRIGSR